MYKSFGTSSTGGNASMVNWIQYEDGDLVNLIKDNGGIPYVKTNLPQLTMIPETVNRIFGWTLNPIDHSWTCGGSSGGGAALIASGCSIFGLGNDIGGSVRIPAAYCNIYGFKGGYKRSSDKGTLYYNR